MKKLVSLFNKNWNPSEQEVDAYLIAVKDLSMRSMSEFTLEEILKIKKDIAKPIYLLCDTLISQSDIGKINSIIKTIFEVGDLVFFQDIFIYQMAKKYGSINKLVYYSPTLSVNEQELLIWKSLGVNHIIISKEATINDYKLILKQCSSVHLGMLAMGYPQIYFSKRKMITSFENEYNIRIKDKGQFKIKEKSRNFWQPIFEDERGTYIFASKVFFPYKEINNFVKLGMEYFIYDPTFFENPKNDFNLLKAILNEQEIIVADIEEKYSSFMLYREMVNDYEKKN